MCGRSKYYLPQDVETLMSTTHRWWARHIVDEHDTRYILYGLDWCIPAIQTNKDEQVQSHQTILNLCRCVISIHQTILIHTNVFSDDGDKWNSNEYSTSADKFIPVTWLPKCLTQNQSYEYTTKATKACNKQQVKCKELLELLFLLSLTEHIPSVV